ncbi:transmembrane and ubiquitin-like domain-containing protein 1 [Lethenteron reissneri]|uniref:transmembrane and ubiquitin-like domain-containing protein 1 n=1 Tax=Lethenteron reissneri TaxID=7753 RepID=UPI002AB6F64B|nr:transmembrane and ubiquitin-like domain-containing protein 1 [Lethenteron reissneri]XP_061419180.1 transmembrane and ubiquitin-like domain-containing protein 1 [Lethenteron reissneri]XP_061419181.1 transmembrane and ubiquitin-like domain-containing protein 1 [Lethenteron reissneri]XP_061419182.1 transmembrane and ubiquitin-like domain-containing protein 1 [Lethenteron reissneri]
MGWEEVEPGPMLAAVLVAVALVLAWLSTYVEDSSEQLFRSIVSSSPIGSSGSSTGVSAAASPTEPSTSAEPGALLIRSVAPARSPAEPQASGGDTESDGSTGNKVGEGDSSDGARSQNGTSIDATSASDGAEGASVPMDDGAEATAGREDPLNVTGLRKRTRLHATQGSGTGEVESPRSDPREVRPGDVQVRLKFLNDSERVIRVMPEDTIAFLKTTHFPGQEEHVKLIYRGQLLRDPKRTLESLGIAADAVLHCQLARRSTSGLTGPMGGSPGPAEGGRVEPTDVPQQGAAGSTSVGLHVLVIPVFTLALCAGLYACANLRPYLSVPAAASIAAVTLVAGAVVYVACRS